MKIYNSILIQFIACSLVLFSCKDNKSVEIEDVKLPPRIYYKHTDSPKKLIDSLVNVGYLNRFSFGAGDTLKFFINATKNDSGSLGIYDVNGKLVDYLTDNIEQQTARSNNLSEEGYKYSKYITYYLPVDIPTGMYFLAKKIPFIVKNVSETKGNIVMVHPSNTDNGYNSIGGKSYYLPSSANRARVLSKARPWAFPQQGNLTQFYKWIRKQPFQIDYISDEDLENFDNIKSYSLVLIVGHSEYWTRKARENFDKFVDSGKNALLLTGNTMYWQVRYDSKDPSLQICHKYDALTTDPINNVLLKTASWEEPKLNYPQLNTIGLSYYAYGGFSKHEDGFKGYKITKPSSYIFNSTNLSFGDIVKFIGWEYDGGPIVMEPSKLYPNVLIPRYVNDKTRFQRVEVLAYDLAVPDNGGKDLHNGLLLALQKSNTSGVILNIGASHWCAQIDNLIIGKITSNSITLLSQSSKSELLNNLFTNESL